MAQLILTSFFCPDLAAAQSWAQFITPVDELEPGSYTIVLAPGYQQPSDLLRAECVCDSARVLLQTDSAIVCEVRADEVESVRRIPGAQIIGTTLVMPRAAPVLFFDLISF